MSITMSFKRLTQILNLIVVLVTLLAVISLCTTILSLSGYRWVEPVDGGIIYSNYQGVDNHKARIAIAALLGVFWYIVFHGRVRKLVLIPFGWIFVEYVLWVVGSFQLREMSDTPESLVATLFLVRANWLDIGLIFFGIITFLLLFFRFQRNDSA